ncbi:MAG TPA: hypothetical protein VIG24_09465 [Acidimicrobiia bacterium]
MLRFQANVYGFQATKRLMRQLEPDLLKAMRRDVRSVLNPVVNRAKQNTPSRRPLSRWKTPHNPYSRPSYSPYGRWRYERLEWDTIQARRNIKIREGTRRPRGSVTRSLWQLQSNNPANAAFELMGRGKSNVWMVRNIMRKDGNTGRVLYRAWDQLGGDRVEDKVVDTVQRFEKEFQRRLDAAGGP